MPDVTHEVWSIDGILLLANGHDPHYVEKFKTREEFEAFVARLKAEADKLWPEGEKS